MLLAAGSKKMEMEKRNKQKIKKNITVWHPTALSTYNERLYS